MNNKKQIINNCKLLAIISLLLQCNCFYALQSFNHGKLLDPGETKTTYAMARRPFIGVTQGSYSAPPETLTVVDIAVSLDYRLGVLAKKPFGQGLEVGFHLEHPAARSFPLLEFDGRVGLPALIAGSLLYHHNVGVGWMVGQWVDNGWYIEYAGGFETSFLMPYANVRAILSPTPTDNMNFSINTPFLANHQGSGLIRGALGCTIKLPRIAIAPDYIIPEFSVVYPDPWNPARVTWSYQIGLGWYNGL